jgi:hypothetical protein
VGASERSDVEENPVEVTQRYIDGINWPASKDEVVKAAERNGAPEDVLEKLRVVSDERFDGPNRVHNALWGEA